MTRTFWLLENEQFRTKQLGEQEALVNVLPVPKDSEGFLFLFCSG